MSSTSISGTCARRWTGRSAGTACRPCVASDTASSTGRSTRMTFPLRLRLTLAFGLSVALVLAGLAVFLYLRLDAELQHGLDLDLRSRAGLIAAAGANHGPVTVDSARSLID